MSILYKKLINEIHFSTQENTKIIEHCLRKLNGEYLPNEVKEKQAYGVIGGRLEDTVLLICRVIPLYNNGRINGNAKNYMDEMVGKYAIHGDMPLGERGWLADKLELKHALNVFQQNELQLVGTYHMHHLNSWRGNEPRDEPTELDRNLGKGTGLLTFIVAVTDIVSSKIRAFYEGCCEQEVQIYMK